MTDLKMSVALCTYNGAKYLKEQLDSINNQTRLPDEFVICDDVSTDDTIDIIHSFKQYAGFQIKLYVNDNNLGSTKNFEKAISLCSGDIIILSDQDDVWYPDKLKKIENAFLEDINLGAMFSNAEVVDEHLTPLGYNLWGAIKFNQKERRNFKNKSVQVLLKHNVVTGATLAFRSSFKDKVLPIPDLWVHDAWIAFIISTISEITPIDESLIRYRKYSGQQIGVEYILLKNMISMIIRSHKYSNRIYEYVNGVKKYRTNEAVCYKMALDKYKSIEGPKDNNIIKMLNKKIIHSKTRARLPYNRILRIPIILKELILFRYTRYSHRAIYALIDLIF